jgi:hypothetical protein
MTNARCRAFFRGFPKRFEIQMFRLTEGNLDPLILPNWIYSRSQRREAPHDSGCVCNEDIVAQM